MDIKEQKMKESVFFVEANSYERSTLWKEFKDETSWVQDYGGFTEVIGCIDEDREKPVNLCFTFEIIFGLRICFYEVVSRYSDKEMINEWLQANYPQAKVKKSMDFDLVVDQCKSLTSNNIN